MCVTNDFEKLTAPYRPQDRLIEDTRERSIFQTIRIIDRLNLSAPLHLLQGSIQMKRWLNVQRCIVECQSSLTVFYINQYSISHQLVIWKGFAKHLKLNSCTHSLIGFQQRKHATLGTERLHPPPSPLNNHKTIQFC